MTPITQTECCTILGIDPKDCKAWFKVSKNHCDN